MDKPKISYFVQADTGLYTKQNSAYIGTYTGTETLSVNLRIWNNYRGTEDVEYLENFNLILYFLTEEDNALLKYITLTETTRDREIPVTLEEDTLVGRFLDPVILSGKANTGSVEYTNNYIDITVSFKTGAEAYLKDHDLKSLVLDIVEI